MTQLLNGLINFVKLLFFRTGNESLKEVALFSGIPALPQVLLFSAVALTSVFLLFSRAEVKIVLDAQPVVQKASSTLALSPVASRSPRPTPQPTPTPIPSIPPTPIPLSEKPTTVKAMYFTSWSASTPSQVALAINLIKKTELNAIVIDIKDYSGKVAFITNSPLIKKYGSEEKRIANLTSLVSQFHQAGIYVIVRIAAFQDQQLISVRPDLAVRSSSGTVWRDNKRLGWVDPGSKEVWEYLAEIGREATRAGVDELNFDYIRFPSDGALGAIRFPFSDLTKHSRRSIIKQFFAYLHAALKDSGAVLSADLFGLATVNKDDLGIGQYLEDALPYFDFVCPMVYPSHYAPGFIGYKNPGAYPYEVIKYSLDRGEARRKTLEAAAALATSSEPIHIGKIRPWLQAFDLGAVYTPEMIKKEKKAVYDSGITVGWQLWSAANRYNPAALEKE